MISIHSLGWSESCWHESFVARALITLASNTLLPHYLSLKENINLHWQGRVYLARHRFRHHLALYLFENRLDWEIDSACRSSPEWSGDSLPQFSEMFAAGWEWVGFGGEQPLTSTGWARNNIEVPSGHRSYLGSWLEGIGGCPYLRAMTVWLRAATWAAPAFQECGGEANQQQICVY